MTGTLRVTGSEEPGGYGEHQDDQQKPQQPGQQPVEALLAFHQGRYLVMKLEGGMIGQRPVQQTRLNRLLAWLLGLLLIVLMLSIAPWFF